MAMAITFDCRRRDGGDIDLFTTALPRRRADADYRPMTLRMECNTMKTARECFYR